MPASEAAPPGPLRIFLSSTSELEEYRAKVRQTIDRMDQATIAMESFGARPKKPFLICKEEVERCHALIVIVGHCYGWIPPASDGGDGKTSITWWEVKWAVACGKPVYAFLADPRTPRSGKREQDRLLEASSDEMILSIGHRVQHLIQFRAYLSAEVTHETFTSEEDVAGKVATSLHRWILDQAVVNATPPKGSVTIEHIQNFDQSVERIILALDLYVRRIPAEERYDTSEMADLIRRHLAGEWPTWRLHLFIAMSDGDAVGMLLCYDDLANNLAFIPYFVVAKPVPGLRNDRTIGIRLIQDLMRACDQAKPGRTTRIVFEVDDPRLAADRPQHRRCIGRLMHFAILVAPQSKVRMRVLNVPYVQPALGWPPKEGPPKKLLLCYVTNNLGAFLPRPEAAELLTWTYTSLYAEDIFEDEAQRTAYAAHIRSLLNDTLAGLPDQVPLLSASDIRGNMG
jgi:Domain of unknown function (DUF4062)